MVTRHFATITAPGAQPRQVHYRKSGSGPPVVLLHQSPVSSAEYQHLMQQWGDGLTLIAPDSPSFGLSESLLNPAPQIELYAEALAAFLDAIGVERCGIYGTHTGAMIAAEFARAYPQRCDVCVLNGYVVATEDEKYDTLANYFVPLRPAADGSHMAWAWVRMRDQMIFYPWYRKSGDARMTFDVPGPDFLQPFTMDFFRCANDGLRAYKAAFTYDAIAGLRGMTAPCYAMAFQQDVLFEHLSRIPKDIPACVKLEGHPTPMALEARARDLLIAHCKGKAPPHTATATIESKAWQTFATASDSQIYVRRSHMGAGRPVVMLHDAGASSRQWAPVLAMLQGQRPTLAFDLPGHGETGALNDQPVTVESIATTIRQALADLGVTDCDILSLGAGGAVAAHLAKQMPEHVKSLVLVDPWAFDQTIAAKLKQHLVPDLAPTWFGGHLLQAWAVARDAELYWPWFEPLHANRIVAKPNLDPTAVHAKAIELLKAVSGHRAFVASAVDVDLAAALKASTATITVASLTTGPHAGRAKELASRIGTARHVALAEDTARWSASLAAMFVK